MGAPGRTLVNFNTGTDSGELPKSSWAPQARRWPVLVLTLILGSCKKPLGAPGQKMVNFSTQIDAGELPKSPWVPQAKNLLVFLLK